MTVDRPFMFVVRDVIDDFIIAAGKIIDINKVKDEF
jgi:serine protease inhibitor